MLDQTDIDKVNVERKRAFDKAGVPSLKDWCAEKIINRSSFYVDSREQGRRLDTLPNILTQRILSKIFVDKKCLAKNVDRMVKALLSSNVTEFNFLSLWDHEEKYKSGFGDFECLFLKCPNLRILKTVKRNRPEGNSQTKMLNLISDVCLLKNLTLLALNGYWCSQRDLQLLQTNLPNLVHLEIALSDFGMDVVDPLAEMSKLRTLKFLNSSSVPDNFHIFNNFCADKNKEVPHEVLVQCAGRVEMLQNFYFECEDGKLFVEKYAAQFPQKQIHLGKVTLNDAFLDIPWPQFVTCDTLEMASILDNFDVQKYCSIPFPIKHLRLKFCLIAIIYDLLEVIGKNVEHLYLFRPQFMSFKRMARRKSGGGMPRSMMHLNKLLARCPKVTNLELVCVSLYSHFSKQMTAQFSNLQSLTLKGAIRSFPQEEAMYLELFVRCRGLVFLEIVDPCLVQIALKAMNEDHYCFDKLNRLTMHITTIHEDLLYYEDENKSVFDFVRRVIFRSSVLMNIDIVYEYYWGDEESRLQRYQKPQELIQNLETISLELGIQTTVEVVDRTSLGYF